MSTSNTRHGTNPHPSHDRQPRDNTRDRNRTQLDCPSRHSEDKSRKNDAPYKRDTCKSERKFGETPSYLRSESDLDGGISLPEAETSQMMCARNDVETPIGAWGAPNKLPNNNIMREFTPSTFASRMGNRSELMSPIEEEGMPGESKEDGEFCYVGCIWGFLR